MRNLSFGMVWCVATLSAAAQPQAPDIQPRLAAVDAAARAALERDSLVGLAIGVIHDGRVAHVAGFGWADREARVPVNDAAMFRWASISKPLTAVAAMQLIEQGRLGLDDDVRRHVPEFPDHGKTITVRQLLCHQGGIVHYANGKVVKAVRDYPTPHPFADVITALDTFKGSPLVNPPGEKYAYTTHGYILLSAVVERAGRKRFADQVAERIARPLGMTTLRPDYQWEPIAGRAVGYRKSKDQIVRSTDTDVSWKLGGGGYLSNVRDLAAFAAGLIRRQLVNEATERQMWTAQPLADGSATKYGLGFGVETDAAGRLRISHSGSQEKTRTMMVIYPRERSGVVVMTNSEWANPGQIAQSLIAAFETR